MHCFALLGHHLKGHKCRECGLSHMGTRKTLSLHRWKMLITLPASLFAGFLCMIAMQAAQSPLQAVLKDHREPCLCVWKCSGGNKLDSNLLLSFLSIARIEDRKPLCKKKVGYNLYFCILKKKKLLLHLFGENCIGHLCVVLLVIPRAVVWPWSSLSKELSRNQAFHGTAVMCCSFTSICKMFHRLIQGNQRHKAAGEFSQLYFSWMYGPYQWWNSLALFGPIDFSVSSVLCCQPVSVFPPDHPLLFLQIIHCFDVPSCFV